MCRIRRWASRRGAVPGMKLSNSPKNVAWNGHSGASQVLTFSPLALDNVPFDRDVNRRRIASASTVPNRRAVTYLTISSCCFAMRSQLNGQVGTGRRIGYSPGFDLRRDRARRIGKQPFLKVSWVEDLSRRGALELIGAADRRSVSFSMSNRLLGVGNWHDRKPITLPRLAREVCLHRFLGRLVRPAFAIQISASRPTTA